MPTETVHSFCRICESLCGIEVTVDREENRVVSIRPNKEHVATEGFACVKGLKQHRLFDSPDRLQTPLKRGADGLQPVAWDAAVSEIGAQVRQIVDDHGPDSIAMYVGTAAGFSVLHPVFAQGFMTAVGSKSMYASATQDCANKFAVARHMYGFPFTQPFPDLDRTQFLMIVGANPAVSKWSFLQVPNPVKTLKEMEARGADIVFIDPRRTESAKAAGQHVPIRPGTDVFFFLGFLRELIEQGGIDTERVEAHMRGMADIEALCSSWTPERVEAVTRIEAATLRELVTRYIQADGAAIYSSTGVNMAKNGTLAFWIQEVINASSGNLDRPGGTLVGHGVIDFPAFGKKHGVLMRSDTSRIGGFSAVNDAYPGGILADEILTPGDRQVRALFVTGGNPLVTMAESGKLREAFENLELLVVLDILPTETASVAHYVLPCTTPLERPDLPFIFPLMLGLQRTPYIQATPRVVDPPPLARDEASIYLDLCKASGFPLFGSKVAQRFFEFLTRRHRKSAIAQGHHPGLPQEVVLSGLLRLCRQGGYKKLLQDVNGRPRPAHTGQDFLGQRVLTDDGRIDLAPRRLVDHAARLESEYEAELRDHDALRLITKRAITTHNSWTHNLEDFVQGDRSTNYLYMHPQDASARELREGDTVDVEGPAGVVRLPLRLLADLLPGTVALPHGWGHQRAKGLSVASKTRGVNVNILASSGPGAVDPVSGMSQLTAINVDVRKAAGPISGDDWDGIATG